MRMKMTTKTFEEYVSLLTEIASPEVVEAFKQCWRDGNRIRAVQILREYKIFDKP